MEDLQTKGPKCPACGCIMRMDFDGWGLVWWCPACDYWTGIE